MRSPILLSASVTVPYRGTVAVPDETQLKNPFKTGMYIDEIRFRLHGGGIGAPAGVTPAWQSAAPVPAVKFILARRPITEGFVPIDLLAKHQAGGLDAVQYGTILESNEDFLVWKPKKPIYVPPNGYLEPTFYGDYETVGASQTVVITYAGRSLAQDDKVPAVWQLPYACAWLGQIRTTPANTEDQSTEADLRNPFDVPLRVQRFTGRLHYTAPGTSGIEIERNALLVRMSDSLNQILVRDPTPFGHLFQLEACWNVDTVLAPHGWYQAFLTENYLGLSIYFVRAMIGMIGTREEVLR